LKPDNRVFWIVNRYALTLVLAFAFLFPFFATAQTETSSFTTTQSPNGRTIHFSDADLAFDDGFVIPRSGWTRGKAEQIWQQEPMPSYSRRVLTVWVRMSFPRSALDGAPLAIFTENNRERIMVFVNGAELYRSFGSASDPVMGWNYPYMVPIPLGQLHEGTNEVILRIDSGAGYNLSTGSVRLGPHADIQQLFSWQNFWRIDAARSANYAMLLLTLASFLMWVARRKDIELVFLGLSGVIWFVRNYHFFAVRVPFDPPWFIGITYYSTYFATAASLAFCITFLKLPNASRHVAILFASGAALCMLRLFLMQRYGTDMLVNLLTLTVVVYVAVLILKNWWRVRSAEHLIMFYVVALVTLLSLHDIGRTPTFGWWDGLGFHAQPYIGALLCVIFLLSFGRRAVRAFSSVEGMNKELEDRVILVRGELAKSEVARRQLEVAHALEIERERLMREMHDGIGSNLVTALAIAEQQDQPASIIATLRRAVSDLKITVDSLEPVDGDLVALIANLRHRMEPDLRRAGLVSRWRVEPCQPLHWLDATNALHVLRIFQEAISNILTHAEASELEIGCCEQERHGVRGLLAFISDNGQGFDVDEKEVGGKGIANMRARALSLHGQFDCKSGPEGTRIDVWLPYQRGGVVHTEPDAI
jgi:signal transduction histidine kinase